MKLLAALILTLLAALIVGGFFLAIRAAARKYRETGSLLLEGRSGAHGGGRHSLNLHWAGMPLIVTGVMTLFKGPILLGLPVLVLGITIAVVNRLHDSKWERGGG